MLSLFYKKDNTEYPFKQNPKWLYIKYLLNEEIDKIIEYYYNRESKVDNDNMLVRIINTLDIDYTLSDFDYLERVEARSDFISKNFDIVSKINYGAIKQDIIFKNSKEIFILDNKSAIDFIEEDYREFRSLKLINYKGKDFNLVPPSEEIEFIEESLNIFTINVNILMLEYKYWALERIDKELSTNPSYFIYKVVLPKLLKDMIDFIILNRMIDIYYYDNVIINTKVKHNPFIIRDMGKDIDRVLKDLIRKDLNNKPMKYKQFLEFIPGIINDNIYDLLFLDNINSNRQVFWSYFISRIREINFILELSGKRGRKENSNLINELEINIKQLERENILIRVLDEDLGYEVEYILTNIKNIINYSR